jgi:6-methylsalicylate decarboxylase
MQELNARKAVVFIHPTSLPGTPAKDIPPFVADFMLDTTRAVIRLITSGTLDAFPDIRFILPHGGGFLPYAATRIARTTANPDDAWPKVMKQMQSFHFDLAMSATPTLLPSLLAFVGADKVCIGSDIPFPPLEHIQGNFRSLANYPLSDEDRHMIRRGTAEKLFNLK